eukprot:TRINITY_DN7421_c0_g1_i2.p1 TRINITY_DN7421_c0_g1~~TRINITY_DN7421_c0_g1_i2.p1  ORF type:complete len:345 (+),score=58.36 TRINITY_DN7421_c0_g1_i2:202-1236(+)
MSRPPQAGSSQPNYIPSRTMSGPPGIGSPAKQPPNPNRNASNGYARMQASPGHMAAQQASAQQRPRMMSDNAYSTSLDGAAFPTLSPSKPPTSAGPVLNGPSFNSLVSQKQANFSMQNDEFPSLANTRTGQSPDPMPGSPSLGPVSRPQANHDVIPVDTRRGNPVPADQHRYGLQGLKQLVQAQTEQLYPDLHMLAVGLDLNTLGFDLNARTPLSPVFTAPFSDHPTSQTGDLPPCYTVKQVPRLPQRIHVLPELTLFYIFYSMPGDVMQLAAASILQNRGWQYHKDLQIWFKEAEEGSAKVEPPMETGVYDIFDVKSWKMVTKQLKFSRDRIEEKRELPPAPM